jgi:activating signal cointegrator 1
MKAISLWQPWATTIAAGVKRVETRHWYTSYTGRLAIHAAKRWQRDQIEFALEENEAGRLPSGRIPLGAIVATCRLIGCRRTEDVAHQLTNIELRYGDYSEGRFAWFLTDIEALPEPIPYKGAQGFFNVPESALSASPVHTGE